MELKHSFTVPVPLDRAWDVLLDVERVAPCMPGATLDSVSGDDITGKIKVKVGPISMTYAGKARFTERNRDAGVVTLEASGKETRGAGTASASVRSELVGDGDETSVTVLTNLNVTGKPAQFGRGVMNEVGSRLIGIFASNLAQMLEAGNAAAPAETVAAETVPAEAVPAEAAPVAAGQAATEAEPDAAPEQSAQEQLGLSIEDLNLPLRAYNSLRREGVHTVADLVARTPQQLLAIDNVGPASIEDIRQRLARRGLALSQSSAGANGAAGPVDAFPVPAPADATATSGAPTRAEEQPPADEPAPADEPVPSGAPAPSAELPAATLHTVPDPRPESSWQPQDDAIDLLSVAGFPVLKRALPVAGGLVTVAIIVLGIRHRRRRRHG
jgi:carbon monoxide dehydrogenase subunit G